MIHNTHRRAGARPRNLLGAALMACLGAAAMAAPAFAQAPAKIAVAVFPNPPFVIEDDKGELSGVTIDLANAIAKQIGVQIEISKVASVAAAKVGVQSGRYGMTMGPVLDNADAEKDVTILPWVKTSPGLVYRATASYPDVLDFCGKQMAIVSGSAAGRNLEALGKACVEKGKVAPTVSGFGDANSMVLAVEAGRIDAAAVSSATALYSVSQREGKLKAFVADVDIFGVGQYSGLALRKEDAKLAETVLGAMTRMVADGSYAAIMKKYNITDLALTKMELNPVTGTR